MGNSLIGRMPALAAVCAMMLAGCGGGGGGGGFYNPGIGSASGVVYDQNGNVVRNAQVFFSFGGPSSTVQTVSSTNGSYVLKGIPASEDLIQAQLTSGGVSYFGQNVAFPNPGQQAMTVNIAMYPSTQLASLTGTVSDSFGNLLYGADVYAIPASGKLMNSAYGITDHTGHFTLGGLLAGVAYKIQVNGPGYGSANDSETLTAGQALSVNYTLPPVTNTTLPPPTGVTAVAYTSPAQVIGDVRFHNALESIKALMHPELRRMPSAAKPKVVKRQIESPVNGAIEIDVSWTPISNPSLLGYNIYRSNSNAPPVNVDFLYDPLGSSYEDMSGFLTAGTTYTYAVTTVSTSYGGGQGESPLSNTATATPLGPLTATSVTASTMPTFNWQSSTGALTYAVFVYSQYPDIGVTDIFDNYHDQVTGTTFTYNATPLTSGQTYYYLVVGYDTAGDESVSQVGQFTVP